MIIYKAENIINKKCYIGQTIVGLKRRKNSHYNNSFVKDSTLFYKAIKKYGWNNFTWEILCECETKEELDEMEFHYIKQYHSYGNDNGYNMTWGGEGSQGNIVSKETRKKLSISNSGVNNPMYGRNHTEEAKKNCKEKQLGENHWMKRQNCYGENNKKSKKWEITFPDGHIEIIIGLKYFSKTHNLIHSSIKASANKRPYKGYYIRGPL